MKLIVKAAAVGLAILTVGACNKHSAEGENVIANTDAVADNIQANASNTADAVRASGANEAKAVDNMVAAGNASDNMSSNSSK
jgi:hypothetical protein